jgi:hypothetical protein
MTMEAHAQQAGPPLGRWRLVPLGIWALHASIASAAVNGNCHLAVLHRDALGTGALRLVLYALTAVGVVTALAVAALSYRAWRSAGDGNGRVAFGAAYSSAIAVATLAYLTWVTVAIAALAPC